MTKTNGVTLTMAAAALAGVVWVGHQVLPTNPPVNTPGFVDHNHQAYEDRIYQLTVDIEQLKVAVERPYVIRMDNPYQHERVLERIEQLECNAWGDKPCGVR